MAWMLGGSSVTVSNIRVLDEERLFVSRNRLRRKAGLPPLPRATRVYLAGPMRGIRNFNEDAFDAAASELRRQGYEVFSPVEHDRATYGPDALKSETGDLDDIPGGRQVLRDGLAADLAWIAERADELVLLPGWRGSKGALAEKALADALGVPVFEMWSDGVLTDVNEIAEWERDLLTQKHDDAHPSTAEFSWQPGGEVRVTSDTGGQKGKKTERYELIPVGPLREIARVYGIGAEKYGPRNFELGYDFSLSYAALQRHANQFWEGQDRDDEGFQHLAAVCFHAMSLMLFASSDRYARFDDRPKA